MSYATGRSSRKETLLALLSQGRFTQVELGLRSLRHVRRLLRQLHEEGGMPVQEERIDGGKKRFFLKDEDQLRAAQPVRLSENEMMALVVAVQSARAALAPMPFRVPLRAAFERLLEHWPQVFSFEPEAVPRHWHFGAARSVDLDPAVFRTVARAVRERQALRIDYFTASRQELSEGRKVSPLVLGVQGGAWLVAAWCPHKQAVRDFSLAGIRAASLCDDAKDAVRFREPADFDPDDHFRGRFGAVAGDAIHAVRLLVDADRVSYLRRKVYHPTQHIEQVRSGGRAVVTYEVEGLDDVAAFAAPGDPP